MTAPVIRKGIVWRGIMAGFHALSAVVWPTRVEGGGTCRPSGAPWSWRIIGPCSIFP